MAYNYGILLGRISKVSGFEGALIVKLDQDFRGNITNMESVFLEIEGRPVPFFISESEYSGTNTLRLKFAGYDSPENAGEFTGCRVFLTAPSQEEKTRDFEDLTGYKVMRQDKSLLGTVSEVIRNPGQWLLNVASPDSKGVLIPLHEHLIIKIDKRKKIMIMEIPEGLTEIN